MQDPKACRNQHGVIICDLGSSPLLISWSVLVFMWRFFSSLKLEALLLPLLSALFFGATCDLFAMTSNDIAFGGCRGFRKMGFCALLWFRCCDLKHRVEALNSGRCSSAFWSARRFCVSIYEHLDFFLCHDKSKLFYNVRKKRCRKRKMVCYELLRPRNVG
ncbi:hypothetical protein AUEXF2481DRAFT_440076 [Aureobasidium subglaciale EXF-2481]|uniref:Uncharacterized protein n=1 Tax=Aureobasidium subglaciale (strain EXF-2481) TaxID=1043005 RepID=A0A074YZG4_AURSE|nr:uncharacterized protein AUEXF2481DRAFT_440076 [Aureobasidium subglaciale EXF-2481]KEQ92261.1 hypothetical protein AUEXF2481DRAFT_440076 [Aureobasidium subglaciale EXF-2481]